jgi:hypothetical protein
MSLGLHDVKVATFKYKVGTQTGTAGVKTLTGVGTGVDGNKIPDNALILGCWTECIAAAASAGAATIALGITGNADAFAAAEAYTDNSYDTPGTVDAKANELPLKVDAAGGVDVIATIADATITGAEFDVHVQYVSGS